MTPQINALLSQSVQHFEHGNLDAAEQLLGKVLQMHARNFDALQMLGVIKGIRGERQEAVRLFKKAIAIEPNNNWVQFNLAKALSEAGKDEEAIPHHKKAVQLAPEHADAWLNYGVSLSALGRLEDAAACYERLLGMHPDYFQAWSNYGLVLYRLTRYEAALQACGRALELNSRLLEAWINSGAALRRLGRLDDALAAYRQGCQVAPSNAEVWLQTGLTLRELKSYEAARDAFERAMALDTGAAHAESLGHWLLCKLNLCDWSGLDDGLAQLKAAISQGKQGIDPFAVVAVCDDPQLEKSAAMLHAAAALPDRRGNVMWPKPAQGARIRIAYFSADFHNHATMHLMAELFEKHDKSSFEIIGFSYGPAADDAMRRRAVAAMDRFIDVRDQSDQQIAEMARAAGVDIAVDLKGYTRDGRMGIFSRGAAPVQVSYLGYPGTTGAPCIDYLIADAVALPPDMAGGYTEKVVRMPYSYQVNDRSRAIGGKHFARTELGLPEDGFVFASFNNAYKLAPESFDIWMRLLQTAPGSVLWLLGADAGANENLKMEAQRRGIAGNRLVFAPFIDAASHLARYRQADLFLDTFNYNAHTTASDALWAGLPVLTRPGRTFASRVAASLLSAAGAPELIARSNQEYEALALELVRDREKLAACKRKLESNRLSSPLFDSGLFTRHLEQAYRRMHERHAAGLGAESFDVAA